MCMYAYVRVCTPVSNWQNLETMHPSHTHAKTKSIKANQNLTLCIEIFWRFMQLMLSLKLPLNVKFLFSVERSLRSNKNVPISFNRPTTHLIFWSSKRKILMKEFLFSNKLCDSITFALEMVIANAKTETAHLF